MQHASFSRACRLILGCTTHKASLPRGFFIPRCIMVFDSLILFAPLFFIVAFAYSSVGLGGASSYTAIMVLLGVHYVAIPTLGLLFNIIVTVLASYHFVRQGHLRVSLLLPFLVSSLPMTWFGGMLSIGEEVFRWLLFISLCIVVIRIYVWPQSTLTLTLNSRQKIIISILTGAILGLVAGVVGIGGGIYLVPLILLLGLGTIKEAAAVGAVFVFLNSIIGVASRLQYNPIDIMEYSSFIIAVFCGGMLGSFMGSSRFSPRIMEQILGSIILVALGFLGHSLICG